ncbi:hypothetical protein HDU96_007248 [Phlyctochytrium bullatum]|nr:hypothetical protein HDU96_007248 [Phlyctochytrium bullatum]
MVGVTNSELLYAVREESGMAAVSQEDLPGPVDLHLQNGTLVLVSPDPSSDHSILKVIAVSPDRQCRRVVVDNIPPSLLAGIAQKPKVTANMKLTLDRLWRKFHIPLELATAVQSFLCLTGPRVFLWNSRQGKLISYHLSSGCHVASVRIHLSASDLAKAVPKVSRVVIVEEELRTTKKRKGRGTVSKAKPAIKKSAPKKKAGVVKREEKKQKGEGKEKAIKKASGFEGRLGHSEIFLHMSDDFDDEDALEAMLQMEDEQRAAASSWAHTGLMAVGGSAAGKKTDSKIFDDDEMEAFLEMEHEEADRNEKAVKGELSTSSAPTTGRLGNHDSDLSVSDVFIGLPEEQAAAIKAAEAMGTNPSSSPARSITVLMAETQRRRGVKWGQGFSSSPTAGTSPSFRCEQPTPVPSDWHISKKRAKFSQPSSPIESRRKSHPDTINRKSSGALHHLYDADASSPPSITALGEMERQMALKKALESESIQRKLRDADGIPVDSLGLLSADDLHELALKVTDQHRSPGHIATIKSERVQKRSRKEPEESGQLYSDIAKIKMERFETSDVESGEDLARPSKIPKTAKEADDSSLWASPETIKNPSRSHFKTTNGSSIDVKVSLEDIRKTKGKGRALFLSDSEEESREHGSRTKRNIGKASASKVTAPDAFDNDPLFSESEEEGRPTFLEQGENVAQVETGAQPRHDGRGGAITNLKSDMMRVKKERSRGFPLAQTNDDEPLFSESDNEEEQRLTSASFMERATNSTASDFKSLQGNEPLFSESDEETPERIQRRREIRLGKRPVTETLPEEFTLPDTQFTIPDPAEDEHSSMPRLDGPPSKRSRGQNRANGVSQRTNQSSQAESSDPTGVGRSTQANEAIDAPVPPAASRSRRPVVSQRVLAERKLRKQADEFAQGLKLQAEYKKILNTVKRVSKDYSKLPQGTNMFVKASTDSGQHFFFPYRSSGPGRGSSIVYDSSGMRKDLLGTNIHVILRQVESERATEVRDDFLDLGDGDPNRLIYQEEINSALKKANQSGPTLWVDKYSPRMYIDLVGDEILLLAGPAGLGKTTLAHVVARHAGYEIVEINASDDRAGEGVIAKIKHALESKSIKTGKPNLIIIDEIDGAAAGGDNVTCRTNSV